MVPAAFLGQFTGLVSTGARVLLGVIFLLSSLSKLLEFKWFAGTLAAHRFVPRRFPATVAAVVVATELSVAVALLSGLLMPWSVLAAASLLLIFAAVIVANIATGHAGRECGCFGFWKKTRVGWELAIRNLGLMGMAVLSSLVVKALPSPIPLVLFLTSVALVVGPFLGTRPDRHRSSAEANGDSGSRAGRQV